MSRIGNAPSSVPKDVTITADGFRVVVHGPKGELVMELPSDVTMRREGESIRIKRKGDEKATRAIHGYVRAQLANLVKGVTAGWTRTLELSGVGYRAAVSGVDLSMTIGFSHPVHFTPPAGIEFEVVENKIIVSGIDKQLVGQMAAMIRSVKPPEPYNGKGITYQGEHVRKKAGKAKAVAGAPGGAK